MIVTSTLEMVTGQVLRLRLVSQAGGTWLFQPMPTASSVPASGASSPNPALMAAFLSRGLPTATDRLALWAKWASARTVTPFDQDSWAASLEARGASPQAALTRALEPWLAWQAALESGESPRPPKDESCWDDWNLRPPPDGAPWLVMPLHWEYHGQGDSGLLQAHWNPEARTIDRWHLTAAPASIPFRLEARVHPESLELIWRFFRSEDRLRWEAITRAVDFPRLSSSELMVKLVVTGVAHGEHRASSGGIDVQA